MLGTNAAKKRTRNSHIPELINFHIFVIPAALSISLVTSVGGFGDFFSPASSSSSSSGFPPFLLLFSSCFSSLCSSPPLFPLLYFSLFWAEESLAPFSLFSLSSLGLWLT